MRFQHPTAAVLLTAMFSGPAIADARLNDYNQVDLSTWEPRIAPSVMALVEPIYRGHPEGPEGRPTLNIDLREGDTDNLVIEIELRGYLDDSVNGEQYRGIVVWSDQGWRLEALGQRNICARGSNAGVPTTSACP